jgi:hypothetical protein
MTLRKLTIGEVLAGLAGALLVVDLFAPWFEGDSAWHALSVLLAFLLITAVLGLTLFVTTAFQRSQAIPVAAEVFAFSFASVTAIFLLLELVLRDGPEWGAWLGFVAVVAIASGAWFSLRAAERP